MKAESGSRDLRAGILTADLSPVLIRLLAQSRVDFVVLDAEQTGILPRDCADVVQRLLYSSVHVAVRVPDLDERTLVEFANTGAHELVLPRVRSPHEVEDAHRATRYPPSGRRSKQVSYASSLGTDYSLVPRLSVLFETVEAIDNVAEFAASKFVEGMWVGPNDLAMDLEAHGRGGRENLEAAIDRTVAVMAEAGHSIGLPASSVDGLQDAFARGADRCAVYWERQLGALVGQVGGAAAYFQSSREEIAS
ncbi:aldolase/citrate lyase family protein [Rhizohabitans arisaemae]|uniref:aldolase/citrate lyase family protein n=1 Tax=Rhizohabitans arisaemae TaxID=2720610 RepID=UPI0024B0A78D|nr:aldolase/citrate lyase family protein [Rhizohabitans arisaemae]